MTADLQLGDIPAVEEPYWGAIAAGRLDFQRCSQCLHAWLPPREECPNCLARDWAWVTASGNGEIVSWVVYHTEYHPAMRERIPYNVAIVRLDEGPQMISNLVKPDLSEVDYDRVRVGGRVGLLVATRYGALVPLFTLLEE